MTRRRLALTWIAAAAILLPLAPRTTARLAVGAGSGELSEASTVEQLLATRFRSSFATPAVLVAQGIAVQEPGGRAALEEVAREVTKHPAVIGVLSYLDSADPVFVDPRGTFLVIGLRADAAARGVVPDLRRVTAALQSRLRAGHPTLALSWTGAAPIDHDVRLASASSAATAERRVLPLTFLLLVVVFGGVVAAVVAVGAGVLAIGLAMGAAALVAERWGLTILLQNIVSMIGLGLGIDYALLMITRFRELLAQGVSPAAAADGAARTAGRTILLSGAAVALGFAPLLVIPANELRSIAIGGLLVITASVLVARSLLPLVLSWLGPRIDRGRRASRRPDATAARWRRWGRWIVAHPILPLVVVLPPLLLLAAQAARLDTSIPSGTWLPPRLESTRGAAALSAMGHAGVIQTLRVVVALPETHDALSDAGWLGVRTLARSLAADTRVAQVRALPLLLQVDRPSPMFLSFVPPALLNTFVSRDARLALIEVEPTESATPGALVRLVREVRAWDAAAATGVDGVRLFVGGLPGANADYEDAVGGSARNVILLIFAGTLVALFIGFRSALIPLKAVVLNALSVAAAIGATVLVFQDGHGLRLVGLDAPIDGLFPAVPIIVFAITFGLSMDYETFLVARVAEEVRAGRTEDDALVEGLARTGGVITSAALVMLVVFAGFAAGDFLIVKILGFALAVAVLIDATIVRMVVGPALLRLAGRWNWWPGR